MQIGIWIILGYLLSINVWTFFVRFYDKRLAQKKKWRIKESTLLTYIRMGGGFASLIASGLFHHKTIKGSFLWKVYGICLLWVVLALLILYFY